MKPNAENPAIPQIEAQVTAMIASGADPDDVIDALLAVAEGRPTSAPGRTHALCQKATFKSRR